MTAWVLQSKIVYQSCRGHVSTHHWLCCSFVRNLLTHIRTGNAFTSSSHRKGIYFFFSLWTLLLLRLHRGLKTWAHHWTNVFFFFFRLQRGQINLDPSDFKFENSRKQPEPIRKSLQTANIQQKQHIIPANSWLFNLFNCEIKLPACLPNYRGPCFSVHSCNVTNSIFLKLKRHEQFESVLFFFLVFESTQLACQLQQERTQMEVQ